MSFNFVKIKKILFCICIVLFCHSGCAYSSKTKSDAIVYKRTRPVYNPGGKLFLLDEDFVKQYNIYVKKRNKFVNKNPQSVWKSIEYGNINNVEEIDFTKDVNLSNSGWSEYNLITQDGKKIKSKDVQNSGDSSFMKKIQSMFGPSTGVTEEELSSILAQGSTYQNTENDIIDILEESL